MRFLGSALLVAAVYALVTWFAASDPERLDPYLRDYVVEHFNEDTHARNAVASILVNYRMYDTMFEALILLCAIIGMNEFLPRPGDLRAHAQRQHGEVPTDE